MKRNSSKEGHPWVIEKETWRVWVLHNFTVVESAQTDSMLLVKTTISYHLCLLCWKTFLSVSTLVASLQLSKVILAIFNHRLKILNISIPRTRKNVFQSSRGLSKCFVVTAEENRWVWKHHSFFCYTHAHWKGKSSESRTKREVKREGSKEKYKYSAKGVWI